MMTTEKDTRYNGWTNYETWLIRLWIDNEQGSQSYWQETAQEIYDGLDEDTHASVLTHDEQFTYNLSERMKEEFETAKEDILENAKIQASFWADLLGAALSEVNWHEIATSYLEDVKE